MSLVSSRREGVTAVITYANPAHGTMTAAGAAQTYAAMKAAVDDDTVRAIVLTGGLPGIFIRHYDVGELANISDVLHGVVPLVAPAPVGPGFADLVDLIAAAPKPVIAAINGLCMGGGFEISLACDLRVAAPEVEAIGLPETRIGIFPGGGGTQRLPRVIGEARALEFILRGRTVGGIEAGEMGLVHEVAADPLARALEIAAEFAVKGAEGVAAAKRLTRAALDRPLSDGLADERKTFVEVLKTQSAQDALRAASSPAVSIQRV